MLAAVFLLLLAVDANQAKALLQKGLIALQYGQLSEARSDLEDASRADAVDALHNYKVDEKGNNVEEDGVGVIALRGYCDAVLETIPETHKAQVKDLFDKHDIELDV